jgi:dTDP-4-dehydrorhamnose reductase
MTTRAPDQPDAPRWLLLGSNGMLGTAVTKLAEARGIAVIPWTPADLDFAEPLAAWPALPDGVTHVVNAAAYTAVDDAEEKEDLATAINGHAVAKLSSWCASVPGSGAPVPGSSPATPQGSGTSGGATLVHISTDYVFDGNADTPYAVEHPRDPVNAYGRSKAVGEVALEQGPAPFLCVRTSWLYAPWGHNFVRTMRKLLATQDTLKVVDDQQGRPTSAPQLAETIADLLHAGATGFFHGTDAGQTTWFGLTRHLADRVGYTGTLEPCDSAAFPRPAKRPAYSVLDLSKTEAMIGPRRTWQDEVDATLEQLEHTEPMADLVR